MGCDRHDRVGVSLVAIEAKSRLLGQSMDPARQVQLRRVLNARPEIGNVISLVTLQLGNDVMVAAQAEMREEQGMHSLAPDQRRRAHAQA